MQAGEVVALFRSDVRGAPRVPLTSANVIADRGFEGERLARPGSPRQVLLIDGAVVDSVGLAPGMLDENITVTGLPVDSLLAGQQLRIGDVILEVTMPCTLCHKLDEIRPGLLDEMRNQRGIFTHVLSGGTIKIGDPVVVATEVVHHSESAST